MMLIYVLSEEAVNDIEEIFEFGDYKFGNTLAIDYLLGLQEYFDSISKNPNIGRERKDLKVGLYSLPYVSHIIFYRIFKDKIRIVRILYGGRDLIKFLD